MQKRLLALLTLFLILGGASGASAQFNSSHRRRGSGTNQTTPVTSYFGNVNLFPLSVFDVGGTLSSSGSGSNGTQSLAGSLIDLEFGVVDRGKDKKNYTEYSIGGWYWGRDGNDLYEVHARALTKSGLGLQAGYLNTAQGFLSRPANRLQTRVDAQAYDLFLLYNLSNGSLDPEGHYKRRNWSLEFGAGVYIDVSQHFITNGNLTVPSNSASANYTFYVSGTYQLSGNLYLTASEWALRIRSQDLNRVALGLGYSF